jgi:hypothetical protein
MRKHLSYFSVFFAVVLACIVVTVPAVTRAATAKTVAKKTVTKKAIAYDLYNPRRRYGDEKIEITDATSRCNTPAMQKVHVKNLEQAKKDGEPYALTFDSVSGTDVLPPLADAYRTYLQGLDMAWEAMEQPYCGFGAFGTSAANKSYNKSVTRIRARFLDAAKKNKTVAMKSAK